MMQFSPYCIQWTMLFFVRLCNSRLGQNWIGDFHGFQSFSDGGLSSECWISETNICKWFFYILLLHYPISDHIFNFEGMINVRPRLKNVKKIKELFGTKPLLQFWNFCVNVPHFFSISRFQRVISFPSWSCEIDFWWPCIQSQFDVISSRKQVTNSRNEWTHP